MNNDLIKAMNEKMQKAIKDGDTEAFVQELTDSMNKSVQDLVTEQVMNKYNDLRGVTDEEVLAKRGIDPLTKEEKTFYEKLAASYKDEMTGYEVTLPITTESKIYDDMVQNHELLNAIDFVDSKGVTEWILSKDLDYASSWGDLNDPVTSEAKAAFTKVSFNNFKLSAWMPVPKTMLDLGLTWLDQYVVSYLSEIIARALEKAIVNGTGQKQPVGMVKVVDVENQATPAVDKEATALEDLSTTSIGAIAAALTNGGTRTVGTFDVIVNPIDYWTLIYPALFVQNAAGQIVQANLPIKIYQSLAVPEGKMVAGLLTNYFATIGFGGTSGKIEYSDHYKFLEDIRTYKVRCVTYGTPKDNVSFFVYDISKLEESAFPTRTQKKKTTA